MKTVRLLRAVCLLFAAMIGFTQTPEHQKMMDDIEKKGLKAQKRQLTAPELLLIGGKGKKSRFHLHTQIM